MFERITTNIVPPEMAALLLPITTSPKIKGFMFRRHIDGLFYGTDGVLTILRSKARVYDKWEAAGVSRNEWQWGRKTKGHWVVVYE